MNLERINYFRLPRDEDGRFDKGPTTQRAFEMALRWEPSYLSETEHERMSTEWLLAKGWSAVRQLASGADVSESNLRLGLTALLDAANIYYPSLQPEAYPGRNDEARDDLRALCRELRQAIEIGVRL